MNLFLYDHTHTHTKRLTLKKNTEICLLSTDERSFCGMSVLIFHVSFTIPPIYPVCKQGSLFNNLSSYGSLSKPLITFIICP